MDNNNLHKDNTAEDKFFSTIDVPFSKSKEEAWGDISERIATKSEIKSKGKVISLRFYRAAAAVIVLVACATFYLKTATNTIVCEKGNHLHHVLPDGSKIELNAASSISYHPYWWNFDREVMLDGEAFFNVEKGEKFSVISGDKVTEVLGTSFNIYARAETYNVFCKTGKVKVSNSISKTALVIEPGELAQINTHIEKIVVEKEEDILSWQQNKFIYHAKPLNEVFEEIERQYNTTIQLDITSHSRYIYTGYFTADLPVDSTIKVISDRFGLQYVKDNKNQYLISEKITNNL